MKYVLCIVIVVYFTKASEEIWTGSRYIHSVHTFNFGLGRTTIHRYGTYQKVLPITMVDNCLKNLIVLMFQYVQSYVDVLA